MHTVLEKTTIALDRAQALGGREQLNCITEMDPTALRQAQAIDERVAQGSTLAFPYPVLVKDNIDVAGMHTTAGSLALADNIANCDAPIIRNLRQNGAVILGKTNMTEFANYTTTGMPGGFSSRGGQVIHAADPTLSPSGFSSGSAVAVAAGIIHAAVGTDTSFSITACAQANGICGLKPPAGTLSPGGIVPIARTLDSAGAMAKDFTTALQLYSAMRDEPLPPVLPCPIDSLRIAVNTANRGMVSPEQQTFLHETLRRLRDGGTVIHEITQDPTPLQQIIMQYEFKPHLEDYLRTASTARKTLAEIVSYYQANPETMMKYGISLLRQALEESPGGLQSTPYLSAMRERRQIIRRIRQELCGVDAVIMTGPTNIMHFCGLPSVTIAGRQANAHGVPRCLILYGLEEHKLYQAALAIEALLP